MNLTDEKRIKLTPIAVDIAEDLSRHYKIILAKYLPSIQKDSSKITKNDFIYILLQSLSVFLTIETKTFARGFHTKFGQQEADPTEFNKDVFLQVVYTIAKETLQELYEDDSETGKDA